MPRSRPAALRVVLLLVLACAALGSAPLWPSEEPSSAHRRLQQGNSGRCSCCSSSWCTDAHCTNQEPDGTCTCSCCGRCTLNAALVPPTYCDTYGGLAPATCDSQCKEICRSAHNPSQCDCQPPPTPAHWCSCCSADTCSNTHCSWLEAGLNADGQDSSCGCSCCGACQLNLLYNGGLGRYCDTYGLMSTTQPECADECAAVCAAQYNCPEACPWHTASPSPPSPPADPSVLPSPDQTPINGSISPNATSSSGSSSRTGIYVGAAVGAVAAVALGIFAVMRYRHTAQCWAKTTNGSASNPNVAGEPARPHGSRVDELDTLPPAGGIAAGTAAVGAAEVLPGNSAGPPTAPLSPPLTVSLLPNGGTPNSTLYSTFNSSRLAGRLPPEYATRSSAPTISSLGRDDPLHLYMTASQSSLRSGHSEGAAVASQLSQVGSGLGDFNIPFSELEILGVLGEGSYGRVYLAEWHATPCAVKLLLSDAPAGARGSVPQPICSSLMSRLMEEADVMLALRHPNCVSIIGIVASPPCLVTEYCELGCLTSLLWAAREDPEKAATLTWSRRLAIALDAAKGLLHLHSRGLVHRDVKTPNLLIAAGWRCKVGDFNLSKIYQESSTTRSSTAAAMNPRWLSPEVMQGKRTGPLADVFAFAVILWELLTWQLPWQGYSPWQIVGAVTRGSRLPLPSHAELPGPHCLPPQQYEAYTALLVSCWAQDPADRPSFGTIIESLRAMLQAAGGASDIQA